MKTDGLTDPRLGKRLVAEARLTRQEKQVERAIIKLLDERKAKVLAALRAQHITAAVPPNAFDLYTWGTDVDGAVVPVINKVVERMTGGIMDYLALPEQTRNRIYVDTEDLTANFRDRIADIGPRIADRIADTLAEGIARGESEDRLAARIDDAFDIGENDAARIARTEMHGVAEGTSHLAASSIADAGYTVTKEWITTLDEHTRAWHEDADEQTVDVTEPFDVDGEDLMYPGDPDGSPENIINCRCSVIYDTPEGQPEVEAEYEEE